LSTQTTQIHITKHTHNQKHAKATPKTLNNVQHTTKLIPTTYPNFIKALTTHNTTQTFDPQRRPNVVNLMRNKTIRLLFLPIAILLWIIGWTMLWAGTRKEQKTQQTQAETPPENESITIIPMIPEEQEQYEA
jgi:hypothetical protein